jgi:hypothetical protein
MEGRERRNRVNDRVDRGAGNNTVHRVACAAARNSRSGQELPIHASDRVNSCAGKKSVKRIACTAALNGEHGEDQRIRASDRVDSCAGKKSVKRIACTAARNGEHGTDQRIRPTIAWTLGDYIQTKSVLVALFAVLFLVLGLGDVLVALHPLRRLSRLVEVELTGVFRADGDVRQQSFEIIALTLRARGSISGPQELLELMVAAPALVFVDRHRQELYEVGRQAFSRPSVFCCSYAGNTFFAS